MTDELFFSIVIPTYNRSDFLRRAVASVLAQEFVALELIIVDDGSTDDTAETVKAFHDRRVRYIRIKNSERGAARNVGIRASVGTYLTFLDSDDYLLPGHLELVGRRLKELNSPEIAHQGYIVQDASGRIIQKPVCDNDLGKALFLRGNIMSCMGVFVRRDIMLTNLFNENRSLAGLEDWELWIRLAAQYFIHYDSQVTSVLLQHDQRGSACVKRRKLEEQCKLFLDLVSANPEVVLKYGKYLNKLTANVQTYLSLRISTNPSEKKKALLYLLSGIRAQKKQLLKRRTFAILRNVIFS